MNGKRLLVAASIVNWMGGMGFIQSGKQGSGAGMVAY